MPTLVAIPVPSGPVVHSTPEVQRYSGCPGHFESSWRNRFRSSSDDRGRAHGLVVRVDRLDPGQVQQRVEQGRGVPGGEHEPVAVGPHRQLGVEPQVPRPERVAHRGQRHRRARVPRVRRLHRVHRQHADGVDGQLVDRLGVEVDVRGRPYGHRGVLSTSASTVRGCTVWSSAGDPAIELISSMPSRGSRAATPPSARVRGVRLRRLGPRRQGRRAARLAARLPARRHLGAVLAPPGVPVALGVGALVGVRAEEVAQALDQVRRAALAAVAVVVRQARRERRDRHALLGRHASPPAARRPARSRRRR